MQKDACRVISVCNQKEGVSKSTTVLNLGIGLAREGKKVLIIDNDPQGVFDGKFRLWRAG